jgi:hypothetical protein
VAVLVLTETMRVRGGSALGVAVAAGLAQADKKTAMTPTCHASVWGRL